MATPSSCPYCRTAPHIEPPRYMLFGRRRPRAWWSIGCANRVCPIIISATGKTEDEALANWEQRVREAVSGLTLCRRIE